MALKMERIEAAMAVSVSELKRNPTAVVAEAQDEPVAVLNHNRVLAYMVPAHVYRAMMEKLDDIALAEIVRDRAGEGGVPVSIDDL